MREFPVFVPHGGEHLAAILTVPEREAHGLAVLLTGIGAPRSHRFQMWTKLARRLAEEGVASVRFDYHGMGDSSGAALEWLDDWSAQLFPEVMTVAREAMRALGVDRVAAVGNCGGAELSLRLAAEMPESVGAMCMLLSVLEWTAITALHRRVRMSSLARALRKSGWAGRVLVKPLRGRRPEMRVQSEITELLTKSVARGRILVFYGENDREYNARVHAALRRAAGDLPDGAEDRFSVAVVPKLEIGGFESLAIQDLVIDTAFEWLTSAFGHPSTERRASLEAASEVVPG